ncbi:MAG TPA: 3-oxoadipate enol-lactonase, partial [Polyangiaceae bacterium]
MKPAKSVYYTMEGRTGAPVLVLSHSLGATLEMWDPQIEALAEHFLVVRYDLRGHGRSPVPEGPYEIADFGMDLLALLDHLGEARVHLCGLSLGGMVSLWVSSHYPERVDRMVVCCTSALLGPPSMWADRATLVRAQGLGPIADAVIGRWFTPAFRERDPESFAAMRAMLASTPAKGYAESCGAIERMDLRPYLSAIRAPTLAIAAADDPAIPPDHLFQIAKALPFGHAAVLENAAHLANVEQPQRMTEL